jgi:hypothetical protein
LLERAAMDRRDERSQLGRARVDHEQALGLEQLRDKTCECVTPGVPRLVMPRDALDVRASVRQRRQLLAQPCDAVADALRQLQVRDRAAIVLGYLGRDHHRRIVLAWHDARCDLWQVVVFCLQPEDRHHRPSGLGFQRAREPDRGRSFVQGVQRAEKQPDLLTCDDRAATSGKRIQRPSTRPAVAEPRLLRAQLGQYARRDRPVLCQLDRARTGILPAHVPAVERAPLTCEVGVEQIARHARFTSSSRRQPSSRRP